ncbi:MAG: glycosyltransferase [Ruminococcaceae bacterium]|nr:glycosyltransferase [Oscillospiraceae bacterium]
MDTPKISILVPVYNVEKYIDECLDSIINQTYKNLEIILVDDGSTDKSGEICDRYARCDSRIKVIHQKNQGLATTRNVLVAAATGDYIGFVDSDDFISPNMYSDLIEIIQKKGADIAMCNIGYVDKNGSEIINHNSSNPISERELTGKEFVTELCDNYNPAYVVTWNKIYIRTLFHNIHYPDGKISEDEAVIHRIAHKCNKIVFTSKIHYFYRQQPTSIMNAKFTLSRLDNLDAILDRILFLTKNNYSLSTINNCRKFLTNDFIVSIRSSNKKNNAEKNEIKEKFKLIKPHCKDLLKSDTIDSNTKKTIRLLLISPFLFFYI